MDDTKKFELERKNNIEGLQGARQLSRLARKLFIETFKYKYSYNFDWLGRPIIQTPQDIVAMQEIVWKVKPDLIIETGIARGGSLILYASILELIGKGEVLGIDIDIRSHNKREIQKHKMFKRIKMIEGSSTDKNVLGKVEKIAKSHKRILVCLDSFHTHDHVLEELRLYSKFVSVGSYLVVFDTIIEYMPKGFVSDRPWDKGNNPLTAVRKFLKTNKDFKQDTELENKLLWTVCMGGFLRRVSRNEAG